MKEDKKLGQKLVSKMTLHFVWGHLSKKQSVLRNTNADFFLEIKVNQIKLVTTKETFILTHMKKGIGQFHSHLCSFYKIDRKFLVRTKKGGGMFYR